jgi:hypothetical protein
MLSNNLVNEVFVAPKARLSSHRILHPLHFIGCDSRERNLRRRLRRLPRTSYGLQMRLCLYRLKSYKGLKNFTFLKNTVCL